MTSWVKKVGGAISGIMPEFIIGGGSTYFTGGGISQQTGYFTAYGVESGGPWGIMYENDWMFGSGLADGGDRWRTAGVMIWSGDASMSIKIATGNPGLQSNREINHCEICGPNGIYSASAANAFRFGSLTLGYKGFNFGFKGGRLRNGIQNNLIHDTFGMPRFKKLNNSIYLNSYYKRRNMYTTW